MAFSRLYISLILVAAFFAGCAHDDETTAAAYKGWCGPPVLSLGALPTTNMASGVNVAYRFSVTAPETNAVAIKRWSFNMRASNAALVTRSPRLREVGAGALLPILTAEVLEGGSTACGVMASPNMRCAVVELAQAYVVDPGETMWFDFRVTLTGSMSNNDYLSTDIAFDQAPLVGSLTAGMLGSRIGREDASFIWSCDDGLSWQDGDGFSVLDRQNLIRR